VPQHIPLALLAAMPPIMAASIDAGVGADLAAERRQPAIRDRADHAGLQRDRARVSATRTPRQPSPSITSTESGDGLAREASFPAARKVTGVAAGRAQQARTRRRLASSSTTTTEPGTRR
jgi:hypothetical protein